MQESDIESLFITNWIYVIYFSALGSVFRISVKCERFYYLILPSTFYMMVIIDILVIVHLASNVHKMDNNSQLYFRVKFTKWATLSQIFLRIENSV